MVAATDFNYSPAGCGIIEASALWDIAKLRKKREEIGDNGKFRRMFDSETDSFGYNVMHAAAGMGKFDICKFLIEEIGVDPDVKSVRGETPLQFAVKGGHILTAKYLIKHGAEVSATDSKGFTAMHFAFGPDCDDTGFNNELLIRLLLKKGADINADSVGGTPLHFAAQLGSVDTVKLLLENNAEPNLVSKFLGTTPLVCAIYSDTNTLECVELLLKAKADPNMSVNGLTPLAHAVEAESNSCIEALLAAGAGVDAVSKCRFIPMEHAAFVENLEAIRILILARLRNVATPTWSLVIKYAEAKEMIDVYSSKLKKKGNDAWDKQDYSSAIAFYSEAIHHHPSDEKLMANRSICWVRMGDGVCALEDAQACVRLKPDWAKAHVREGNAWHLLRMYYMSSHTFKRAYELTPKAQDIERSTR